MGGGGDNDEDILNFSDDNEGNEGEAGSKDRLGANVGMGA